MNTQFFLVFVTLAVFVFLIWFPLEFTMKMRKYNLNLDYLKSGLNYRSDVTGLESTNVVGVVETTNLETSCQGGYFLSTENLRFFDCSSLCKSSEYDFKYINPKFKLVLGSKRYGGSYCMPKDCAQCNLSTGRLINSGTGNVCVSKYPYLFGGRGATKIIGCKGRFLDTKLNKIYNHVISPHKVIDPEEINQDGSWRYKCVDELDDKKNRLINLPSFIGNRWELVPNYCTSLIESGSNDFIPNFLVGICNCTTNNLLQITHYKNDPTQPCSTCISGKGACKGLIKIGLEFEDSINCIATMPFTAKNNSHNLQINEFLDYYNFRFSGNFFKDEPLCERTIIESEIINYVTTYPLSPKKIYALENPIEKTETIIINNKNN